MAGLTIGVAAPTGLSGEVLLERLASAGFTTDAMRLVDPDAAAATRVDFGSARLSVTALAEFDFGTIDWLLVPEYVTDYPETVQRALAADCRVAALDGDRPSEAPSSDNLTLVAPAPRLMADRLLAAADQLAAPIGVEVIALDPASAGGQTSVQRLARECAEVLNARTPEPEDGDVVRAFNAVRAGGGAYEVGEVPVRVTRVEVPIFFGQAVICHLGFSEAVSPEALAQSLSRDPDIEVKESTRLDGARDGIDGDRIGVTVLDEIATPAPRLWAVGDNLRFQAEALIAGVVA